MKKTIQGVIYDTDTAQAIQEFESNPKDPSSLFYYRETLYQTPEGHFFVFASGNAGSVYCKPDAPDLTRGGDFIIALTAAQAEEWRAQGDYPRVTALEIAPEKCF